MGRLDKKISKSVKRFGGKVELYRLDKANTVVHTVYGESKVKTYLPPITLSAIIQFEPSEEVMTELGLDKENVEVLVKVPRSSLIQAGLLTVGGITPTVTQDDYIKIEDTLYNISVVKPYALYKDFQLYAIGARRM